MATVNYRTLFINYIFRWLVVDDSDQSTDSSDQSSGSILSRPCQLNPTVMMMSNTSLSVSSHAMVKAQLKPSVTMLRITCITASGHGRVKAIC